MDPQNTIGAGSSSKKKIIIAVVVIIIIILGLSFMRGGSGLKTYVDRDMGGKTTYESEEGSVTIGGNAMPDNWPSDAPKYPGANIQYAGTSNPQTGEEGAAVMFTTSDNTSKVSDFYKKELASNGWAVEQTVAMGQSTVIAAKKDTRTLGVYITDGGNGQVSVTVGIGIK